MTTQRKPKSPTPNDVDRGGRVYLVEKGKVWEGKRDRSCRSCEHKGILCTRALLACDNKANGGRGYRTLHPVQAVG